MGDYSITVLTLIVIQAIVACGLNVIVGYAGQISLGHAAFFGIGAYASAMLTTAGGLGFWTALPLVLLVTGFVGLVLGLPSLRLKEDFLAITTIGVNFIVVSVFLYVPFFGGALGIGGIPRVLDAGQCNDSYSLAVIALKLKEVFGLNDINDLPLSFDIAWYEQKAVAVLLALLHLGVKGIRLGPTLPAFVSPNVLKVLVENFDIKPITDVEADVEAMMAGK